jgi:hypothetical protein
MNSTDPDDPRRPLPTEEMNQPDPMLQMSAGRSSTGGMTLIAVGAAIILAIVFYGLNAGNGPDQTASTSPAQTTQQPAAGGNTSPAKPGAAQSNEHGGRG